MNLSSDNYSGSFSWQTGLDLMHQDKKVSGGKITFVLTHGIGKPIITNDVEITDVSAILDEYLEV